MVVINPNRVIIFIAGAILSLAIVMTSVQILSNSSFYYDFEFSKLNVIDSVRELNVDLDKKDLNMLEEGISGYLSGKYPDFSVKTSKDILPLGEPGDFFNKREKDHMKDVLVLFKSGEVIRNFILGTVILVFYVCHRKSKRSGIMDLLTLSKGMILGVLILFVLLFGMQYVDFNTYFTQFHEILFSNDLWILDYNTSLLINLLPEQFFIDFVINTMILSFVISVFPALCVLTILKLRRS